MEYKDYYQTLGVAKTSSQDEIQKAYKKLARKFHPDVNREAGAEDRFKEIGEAYEVLKDPEKREKYDRYGSAWKHAQETGAPPPGWENISFDFGSGQGFGASGFSDFFDMLFNAGGGASPQGGGFRQAGRGFAAAGQDQETTIRLSLEEAASGGRRELTLAEPGGGRRTLTVNIPPGVKPGGRIRLSGQGGRGPANAPAGDLYLKVELLPHPELRLEGNDLQVTVPVAPWEAALGGPVSIPTLGGPLTVKIPAGSSSGKKIRLRGKGFPVRKGEPGDLFAELRIVVPEQLDEREKELFEELAKVSKFRARSPQP